MNKKPKGWLTSAWDKTRAINDRLASRAQRWNALHAAGSGPVADYIRADFDTDCPNGLDTQPWAAQSVHVESLFKSPNFSKLSIFKKIMSLRWGGWVQHDSDDTIHLNPIWFSPLSLKRRAAWRELTGKKPLTMAGILPHEFIHTRQHYSDHSGWIRNNAGNDIDWLGMNQLSKPRRMWRKAVRAGYDAAIILTTLSSTISNYYAQNVEMQARMHEILAYGYAHWQKLPVNKTELWAALVNSGLRAPAPVLNELNGTEEGRKALDDFKLLSGIQSAVSREVSTFNNIHDYAGEPDVQEALWTAKYPLLYGELIEFYGDNPGRERLGMGLNPRPVIEVLHELKARDNTPLTAEQARQMAERIPPDLAAPFLNSIILEYPEVEKRSDKAMQLAEALLARKDVTAALFADNPAVRTYTGQQESPPLDVALRCGHVDMVRLLMKAGADPFQRYTMIDMRGKEVVCVSVLSSAHHTLKADEEDLANPSSLPKKSRKVFENPEFRKNIEGRTHKKRAALQAVLDESKEPHSKRNLYFGANIEETSLSDLLSGLQIFRHEEAIKTEHDFDMA